MAKIPSSLRQKVGRIAQQRENWEETHPPVTRLAVQEADKQRVLSPLGETRTTCNLPCFGRYIPKKYKHTGIFLNVFGKNGGIQSVDGWDGTYFAFRCKLTGKICATNDENLRKAVER